MSAVLGGTLAFPMRAANALGLAGPDWDEIRRAKNPSDHWLHNERLNPHDPFLKRREELRQAATAQQQHRKAPALRPSSAGRFAAEQPTPPLARPSSAQPRIAHRSAPSSPCGQPTAALQRVVPQPPPTPRPAAQPRTSPRSRPSPLLSHRAPPRMPPRSCFVVEPSKSLPSWLSGDGGAAPTFAHAALLEARAVPHAFRPGLAAVAQEELMGRAEEGDDRDDVAVQYVESRGVPNMPSRTAWQPPDALRAAPSVWPPLGALAERLWPPLGAAT